MTRFIGFLNALSFSLVAVLASAFFWVANHNDDQRLTQNITVEYLEQLLQDLKVSGEVAPTATICDVKWINFGIVVSLNCTSKLQKQRHSADTKRPWPVRLKNTHEVDAKAGSTPTINGDPFIDCAQATADGNPFCTQTNLNLYQKNIEAPWLVSAVDVCNSIISALSIDVSDALACKGNVDYSSIELREGHGDTLGDGEPMVYIRATKASGLPPVYRVMVVASPRDMVDANGVGYFERFEYLVFWTYARDGSINVSAEVVNSFQGNFNHRLSYVRGLDLNTPDAVNTLRFIPGTSRPALFRGRIVTSVRDMTVTIRDNARQPKLRANKC